MLDSDVLNAYEGHYEKCREERKLGSFGMFLVFVKSIVGLAIFGYHQIYERNGIYFGLIISAVYVFCVAQGCMRTVTFAEELEAASEKQLRVENLHELIELMEVRNGEKTWLGAVSFGLNFFSIIGFMLGSFIAFNTLLVETFEVDLRVSTFAMIGLVGLMLLYTIEPERLLSISIMSLVVFTALFSFSIAYGVKGLVNQSFKNSDVQYWKFDQISLSCGYVISSLEMTNTVLNLRRLMSEQTRHKFQTVGYASQYFCAVVSALAALIMYMAFYQRGLQDLYFKTFFEHKVFKVLYFFYPLILANNLLSCTIFEIEMLEKIKMFQKMLRNEARELSRSKIFIARITFFSLIAVIASFLSDLRKVYSISGIFLNSSIALIIPGYLSFKRPQQLRMKDSTVNTWTHALAIFFGLLTIVLYIKETLF